MRVLRRRWVTAGFNPSCKDDATCRSIREHRISLGCVSGAVWLECAESPVSFCEHQSPKFSSRSHEQASKVTGVLGYACLGTCVFRLTSLLACLHTSKRASSVQHRRSETRTIRAPEAQSVLISRYMFWKNTHSLTHPLSPFTHSRKNTSTRRTSRTVLNNALFTRHTLAPRFPSTKPEVVRLAEYRVCTRPRI